MLRNAVFHAPGMCLSLSFSFAPSLLTYICCNILITLLPIIFCSVSFHGALKCRSAPNKGFHTTRVCWHSGCFLQHVPSQSHPLFTSCSKFRGWRSLHLSNLHLNFFPTSKEHQSMSHIAAFCRHCRFTASGLFPMPIYWSRYFPECWFYHSGLLLVAMSYDIRNSGEQVLSGDHRIMISVSDSTVFVSERTGWDESDGDVARVLLLFKQINFVRHHPTARYRPVNLWTVLLKSMIWSLK